jgi:hypothetical protein
VRRHAPSWTHNAAVAQLAEQRTFNPKVVGSIPTGGITVVRGYLDFAGRVAVAVFVCGRGSSALEAGQS